MVRIQHLPLYQSVFIYTREVYRLRTELPKTIKHDLGQEVCESSIKLLKCVVVANGAIKKDRYLNRLLLEVEVQWALLRLLYELKAVSAGQFKLLSERLADITKQSQACFKWVQASETGLTCVGRLSYFESVGGVATTSPTSSDLKPSLRSAWGMWVAK